MDLESIGLTVGEARISPDDHRQRSHERTTNLLLGPYFRAS